ncbi:2Fe-2S iron-sulfur cluster-binding protein [Leisingera caerulea]|uniref:2Fe-2S iron-sulfur cluster-binding protein n=1 Tax=Leisingera caerulea TaxID=506591 RepID=UPI0021A27543|nr:2Fe-2S iron-sulfur cluster-binding protein [Leisingera caerulea]UWQ86310.1 2Fe-2S iron-sulfur cluster binding domain-containing protein [Leisingera caerulea]
MAGGFRRFRVAEKRRESSIISSFDLVPVDGEALWPARPGQYLTLRVPTEDGPVLKTYSISGDVTSPNGYRITVKREAAPADQPDWADGVGSCWLHNEVEVGDEVEIAAPRGHFVLDEDSKRPVVLLSGGVGLTPLVSMLHQLVDAERDVWFIHACEDGEVQAMGEEVSGLAGRAGGRIRTHLAYRQPTKADRKGARFDSEGVIDRGVLQSLLPLDDYDVYMCGPTPFMVAMYRLLTELGVDSDRIAYEFFGTATSLEKLAQVSEQSEARASIPANAPAALANLAFLTDPEARAVDDDARFRVHPGTEHPVGEAPPATAPDHAEGDVVFARSGKSAKWTETAESLLDLAEQSGLTPEFSCRAGICNSCICSIREGEVEYFEEPLDPPAPGEVLLCCSRPAGRIVLDL